MNAFNAVYATIDQLLATQAERMREAIALVCGDEQLAYGELNQRANLLARHLRALGVGPETLVGICMERSVELAIGILGILKAGGAYLPLDQTYPLDRLAFMLHDAQTSLLITQQRLVARLPDHQ